MVAAVVVIFGTDVAQASPTARTRGDAQAVLQAGFTAGTNINILHNSDANGAPKGILPTGDPQDVRIYPFSEDASYCGSGWHVLNFNTGDSLEFYESRKDLVAYVASIDIVYEIDGTLLKTQRTALKEENFGSKDEELFLWIGFGVLLPPGTLTVGAHQLTSTFIDPILGDFTFTVDFDVLPC